MSAKSFILGGGVTGLAAGLVSGLPVYEAENRPGGICGSYYMRPGAVGLPTPDGEAYRFERGGGHWIFGGDAFVLGFIRRMTALKSYHRRSAVYLPKLDLWVPYPLQNHLRHLGPELASTAVREMREALAEPRPLTTMADWLCVGFGPTLSELFFAPFHELYTAGLWRRVAPQDGYKSPVNLATVMRGAYEEVPSAGYNIQFSYPVEGLDVLARRMASGCKVLYEKRVVRLDTEEHVVHFEDGSEVRYRALLSTLPLNRVMQLSGLALNENADPAVSVLVVNIGARKGRRCPDYHWIYVPESKAGFHRVGFYSNVDAAFLPRSSRGSGDRVAVYVEKAYRDGDRPDAIETWRVCHEVMRELQDWEWIDGADVVDPTWIDVAYTWSWCGSRWRNKALAALESAGIYQVGRFGRWVFQGIADSIRDGLVAGATFSKHGGDSVDGVT